MNKPLEIAIAGCGPAGLSAALALYAEGHRVRIFDRLDSPAPLGSGLMLQPTGLAVLDAMGLGPAIRSLGAPINRLHGTALPSGRPVLDVRYSALGKNRQALAVHRASLFQVLYDAVLKAGIEVETDCLIETSDIHAEGRRAIVLAGGRRLGPFDLVIDALGSRSPLNEATYSPLSYGALWASLNWPGGETFAPDTLTQRYRRAAIMIGVLPIGHLPNEPAPKTAFFWSLKAKAYDTWRERGLEAWKADVHALWPETQTFLGQITKPDDLIFAQYAHQTLAYPAATGLAHVGDSAHCASPQLGQGANMALLDAYALAKAIAQKPKDLGEALHTYVKWRGLHVRLYQALTWAFTPVYQSDQKLLPLLRDRLAGPLMGLGPVSALLAALVAGQIGRPLKTLGLRPNEAGALMLQEQKLPH
ncbi:MAG: NAD(P)/FAD-dependent oxidoreductase [Pseudomonadota bacterium]